MSCYPYVLAVLFKCSGVGFHKMNCLHRPWSRKPSNYPLEKYTRVIWIFHRNTYPQKYMLQCYRAASQLQSCRCLQHEHEVTPYFTTEKFWRSVMWGNAHWDLNCMKYLHSLAMWAEAKDVGGNPSHVRSCCKSFLSLHICILLQYCQQ